MNSDFGSADAEYFSFVRDLIILAALNIYLAISSQLPLNKRSVCDPFSWIESSYMEEIRVMR